MSTTEAVRTARRRDRGFWVQLGVVAAFIAGFAFLSNYIGEHDSAGSALFAALAFALVLSAYEVGYRQGRKEWEPQHPEAIMPPPKQR